MQLNMGHLAPETQQVIAEAIREALLAGALGIPFLGEIPLDPQARAGSDRGEPAVLQPGSPVGGSPARDRGQNLVAIAGPTK
ncbi:MAG: hypothetical protein KDF65_08200 [Anaerolineae bacterium]|nr:hypothetical protein [Anaerolineae bacterium]